MSPAETETKHRAPRIAPRSSTTSVVDVPAESGGACAWRARVADASEWERRHEEEWTRIDQKLRGIAVRRAALDAEEANLLRYAEELKLWRGWGFGSMLEYMERAMGYAPHTASERLRVARALAELPLLAETLECGQITHSAIRELSRVAIPETEAMWLEAVQGKCLREIEAMVSGHRPGDLPDDPTEPRLHRRTITLELSPESYDIWRKLHALAAEEHGQRLSDDELIPALFRRAYCDAAASARAAAAVPAALGAAGTASTAACVDASSTVSATTGPVTTPIAPSAATTASSPAYKIALKRCPDCKRGWQYAGGRDIEVDPAVLELAACDAVYLGSLDAAVPERATMTVTPRKREQVLARDGHCCTVPGCRRNVGLDLHHIEYQSRGGDHAMANLTTVCDLHHRAVHLRKLVIRGVAPDRLTFEFRKPRDQRNVTDDDALPSLTAACSWPPQPRSWPPPPRSSLSRSP
jgi:5-methylcytosine-specific restriction endonuclease McrA